jgi:hypothetical protein
MQATQQGVEEALKTTLVCRRANLWAPPVIELVPVDYPDHENLARAVVYLIAHAPISDADSPSAFFASYLKTSGRAGVGGDLQHGGDYPILDHSVEALKVALGTAGNQTSISPAARNSFPTSSNGRRGSPLPSRAARPICKSSVISSYSSMGRMPAVLRPSVSMMCGLVPSKINNPRARFSHGL